MPQRKRPDSFRGLIGPIRRAKKQKVRPVRWGSKTRVDEARAERNYKNYEL